MNDYIITFYSHFGAIRYKKELDLTGTDSVLMPVPRFLSSSCGTCAMIKASVFTPPVPSHPDEIEQIVLLTGSETYTVLTLI